MSLIRTAHSGQAKSAPRKRLRQQQKRILELQKLWRAKNTAQDLQDLLPVEIVIRGYERWQDAYASFPLLTARADNPYFVAGKPISFLEAVRVNADLNRVSFEREIVSDLLTRGYVLEELEFEIDHPARGRWGKCVWDRDNPVYDRKLKFFPEADRTVCSFLVARHRTEFAGEQEFGLYSTQMVGAVLITGKVQILLHKTILFHKVVLSPPAQQLAQAA